jgi:cell division protein FtsW (lipid II flippase)
VASLIALAATIISSYATGTVVNGARVWIRVGGLSFQPGEFAKLGLVLFMAAYLREKRELLASRERRVLGFGLPQFKHLSPLALMVGGALVLLVLMNDFGTSLLFFGVFTAMLYLATSRVIYVVGGLIVFALGAYLSYRLVPHVAERVDIWLHPWHDVYGRGYQSVQALYAIADGGAFGTGLGRGYLLTNRGQPVVPAIQTDFIYAAIANETGLAGVGALLLVYLLVIERGLKTASLAGDGFSKLLAAGLTIALGLQVFLIVGGIVRAAPLTGITLPPCPTADRRWSRIGRAGLRRLHRARRRPRRELRYRRVYAVLASGVVLLLVTAYWHSGRSPRSLRVATPTRSYSSSRSAAADPRGRRDEAGDQPRGQDGDGRHVRAPLPDEDVRARRRLQLRHGRPRRRGPRRTTI